MDQAIVPDGRGSTDFGFLRYLDDYAPYFRALQISCTRFAEAYGFAGQDKGVGSVERFESAAVAAFTRRLLASIAALRIRYSYQRDKERPLYVDLSDSGFPNYHEISRLESDVELVPEKLAQLPALPALKRKLTDRVVKGEANPKEELALLSERSYFELIGDPSKLLLTFSEGALELLGATDERRQYAYAWGSYDPIANQPCLYTLVFDQSVEYERLEEHSFHRAEFVAKIRAEGSRSSPIAIMAIAIDELQGIYPKVLKRLTLGPLFAPRIFDARDENGLTSREQSVFDLLRTVENQDTFLLCASDEFAISDREEIARSFQATLGLKKDIRQIFRLPQGDPELSERRASELKRYALLPHQVVQHLSADIRQAVPELGDGTVLFPFNQKGEINYVSRTFPERDTD